MTEVGSTQPSEVDTTSVVPQGPGCLAALRYLPGVLWDRIGVVEAARGKYGGLAMLRLGPFRIILVADPAVAQEVLRATDRFPEKGVGLREARYLLGDGLLTSSGEQWEQARRALASIFGRNEVDATIAESDGEIRRLMENTIISRGTIFIQDLVDRIILASVLHQIIGRGHFGKIDMLLRDFNVFSRWLEWQLVAPLPRVTSLLWPFAFRARRARRRLRSFTDTTQEPPSRFASLLHNAGLADSEVDQAITFLLAGYETTSAAVAWTLELLSKHESMAEAVAAEAAILAFDRAPSVTELSHLNVTRAAVKEAIRLYPPVWLLPRRAPRDTSLAGFFVPGGTDVLINVYGLHRNAALWPQPDEFRPLRFLTDQVPKGAYLPFGAGPRQCIGLHLALAQATLLVARIIGQFHIFPDSRGVKVKAGLTLRPSGLHLHLVPRKVRAVA